MANALILWPNRSDTSPLYTPSASGGSWLATSPLSNLADRYLYNVARSSSVFLSDTRFRRDLGVDRSIAGVVIPKHTLSSAGLWRVIGVPSTALFNYEAGDDIAALGGTFSRTPTATVRAATYVDRNGVVQYAGENRLTYSEQFDNAAWTKTSVTVSANSVAAPVGSGTTADTLTATGSNGTCTDATTTTAVTWTFSVWLKRLTGSGNVDISMDGTTWVTQSVTTTWQRFSVSQTGVAGTSNPGIRIATSGNAVYAWGAQAQIGSMTAYLPTTSAAVSALRDEHYPTINGPRTTLLEPSGTNICLQSEDLGTTWSAIGTPTRSAAAHTAAGVSLDLIGDDNAAGLEGYSQVITFTGNGVKSFAFFCKAGTSTSTVLRLRDTSASANRILVAITWSGGLPVITATTGASLGYETLAGGVFRILVQSSTVTAANTNQIEIYPATDAALATNATGNVYVGGFHGSDMAAPSSYIRTTTTTVTRSADWLSFTWGGGNPQAMSAYADYYDKGMAARSVADGASRYICWLGAANNNFPAFQLRDNASGVDQVYHNNNVDAAVTSEAATPVTYGQRSEIVGTLASTGAVQLIRSVNGAASTTASASSAPASGLAAAWAGAVLTVGARGDGGGNGNLALRSLRFVAGVQTLSAMQTCVSDSGWLDAWPSGIDAEESEGMNLPLLHLLDAAFSARYWSFQFYDPTNSAGYIDLARLVIAPAIQPEVNFAYGAEFGIETSTTRERFRSGVAHYDEQPTFRRFTGSFEHLTEAESYGAVYPFIRIAGTAEQFYFVADPDDTYYWHRSFLATLERTSGIRAAYLTRGSVAFDFVEEL